VCVIVVVARVIAIPANETAVVALVAAVFPCVIAIFRIGAKALATQLLFSC